MKLNPPKVLGSRSYAQRHRGRRQSRVEGSVRDVGGVEPLRRPGRSERVRWRGGKIGKFMKQKKAPKSTPLADGEV